MRLKTLTASDMQAAMQEIRAQYGEDAIIVSTAREPGGRGISVTIATEAAEAGPHKNWVDTLTQITRQQDNSPQKLHELETILHFHSLPDPLRNALMQTAGILTEKPAMAKAPLNFMLAALMEASFGFSPLPLEENGWRFMLIGPPGIGKTMTVAKIAAQMAMQKRPVTVITTDNQRAGGVEQLSAFTSILGLELKVCGSRNELRAELKQLPESACAVLDSAGSNAYDFGEMKALGEFASIAGVEPVLVAAAGGDASEAQEIVKAFSFLNPRRLLITRADTARRFGGVLAAAHAGGLSFCNVSSTGKVIGEFISATPQALADLLLKHKEEK